MNADEYYIESVEGLDIYISKRLEIQEKGFQIIEVGILIKRIDVDGIRII
ncbi:MAG: hypothetical protein RBR00_02395 [Gudongella oleilytica]|jgi:hypothetical protein|nr:hypothetical protein [Gudongella oleilytica]